MGDPSSRSHPLARERNATQSIPTPLDVAASQAPKRRGQAGPRARKVTTSPANAPRLAADSANDHTLAYQRDGISKTKYAGYNNGSDGQDGHNSSGQEPTGTDRTVAATTLSQSDLLGLISHELRSPLAAIKGYASTLRRHEQRLSASERHECLQAIEDATTHLNTIIERILLFSEIEAGQVVPARTPVDMATLVEEAVLAAQTRLTHPAAPTLHFTQAPATNPPGSAVAAKKTADGTAEDEPEDGPKALVYGDHRLLRVVLDELIENAIKFTPHDETINLAVRVVGSTSGSDASVPRGKACAEVEVTVRNTGSSIAPESLGRIFDHFHQGDSGLTREVGGLGLGLAICQRIVALHNGTVSARSDTDGTALTLRLPQSGEER